MDAGGYTALHHAVRRSWVELEAALLEAGAPAEVAAADGQHPVHWAAVYGCVRALHLLAADGARLDRRDPAGCAPLLFAAHHGRHLNVHYLLHRGAPVNDCDAEGHTALHRAAARGHYLVCRELLDAGSGGGAGGGANVALRDGAGLTALHWAAVVTPEGSNKRRLLRLLLDHGADPEAVDGGGRTVPTHAEAYGFRRTAALLADAITDHHQHPRTAPRTSGGLGAAFVRGAWGLVCGGGDMNGGVRQGRLYVTVFYCSLAAGLAIYWVQLLPRTVHSVGFTLGLLTAAATEVVAAAAAAPATDAGVAAEAAAAAAAAAAASGGAAVDSTGGRVWTPRGSTWTAPTRRRIDVKLSRRDDGSRARSMRDIDGWIDR